MIALSQEVLKQDLPARHLERLTLVSHKKAEMQAWVNNLPIMNVAESGKKLYQTLKEFTNLNITEELRFELLEVMEPAIHNLISTLAKHTLNQPVLLSTQAARAVAFMQALHGQLALNYKMVAIESLRKLQGRVGLFNLGKKHAQQLAATAIQRVIGENSRSLLESYMYYAITPAQIWSDMHGLYHIAKIHGLVDLTVKDRHSRHHSETTIRLSYLRAILLAASQLNKLRQSEIMLLYIHSETWAQFLTVDADVKHSLLVCSPEDCPPAYHHRVTRTPSCWYVHSQRFFTHLQTLTDTTSELPSGLILHLLDVWQNSKERLFERRPCRKPLLLCLGLSATYYFMSGEKEFSVTIKGEEKKIEPPPPPAFLFAPEEDSSEPALSDAWQINYTTAERLEQTKTHVQPTLEPLVKPSIVYDSYQVMAINSSPCGYGICWPDNPPMDLRPGDVIGVYENANSGWCVGILHWVRQTVSHSIDAGLEILSTCAQPCAISLIQRKNQEQSDFLRCLLLPEIKSLDRPIMLVTPKSVFSTGNVVKICLSGQDVMAELTRQVLATHSISLFEFALLGAKDESTLNASSGKNSDIDDLWAQLE